MNLTASIFDLELETLVLPVPDAGASRETAIGDVDGDGTNELVVSTAAGMLYVFSVDLAADLTLREAIVLPAGRPGGSQWISPQIEDIDGDGDADLVTWWRRNNASGYLDVAYQDSGSFQVVSYPTPDTDAGYRMALADFNGDGLKDVLTVNHGFSAPVRLFVLYNDPDPLERFVAFEDFGFPGANKATGPFATDLDGDGVVDVAVTTHDAGPFGLRLLFGGDLEIVDLDPGDNTRSSSVAFGDIGTDGVTDVVTNASVPSAARDFLWLYEQLPGRTFATARKLLTSGDRPKMPMFADLDGDSLDELVVSVTADRTLDVFGRGSSGEIVGPPRTFADPSLASVDHGFTVNPNVLSIGDVDNDGDLDLVIGGDGTVLVRNNINRAPVALCADRAVAASDQCLGEAEIDAGSFDPDGDALWLTQDPPGPFELGTTSVTLTAVDEHGAEAGCEASVTIEDLARPALFCNAPATITPPNAPVSFVATASDNCGIGRVTLTEYDCFKFTKKGKRIDKKDSCRVTLDGGKVTILDSGGVGDHITWTAHAVDTSGNAVTAECGLLVTRPGHQQ